MQEVVQKCTEARKRYNMRLPKIKFGQLQDQLFNRITNDVQARMVFLDYSKKVNSVVYKAIVRKKMKTKKKIDDFNGGNLSTPVVATIVTFTLVLRYILREIMGLRDYSQNFELVCSQLSDVVFELVVPNTENDKEERKHVFNGLLAPPNDLNKNIHRWNYSVLYAYEFLCAPVCIFRKPDNVYSSSHSRVSEVSGEFFMDLKKKVEYTSLWRFLNNLHVMIRKVQPVQ